MKKISVAAIAMISLFFVSCQKELNFDTGSTNGTGGTGGNTNGNLLVKTVSVSGSETTTTLYTYDNQQRRITMTTDGVSGGMPVHNYMKYEYDAAGRVVRIKQLIGPISGVQADTAINDIHYPNATTVDMDYAVNKQSLMGFTYNDSSLFTYSGGKITSVTSYAESLGGTGYQLSTKYDYMYDGSGRVSTLKMFDYSSGTMSSIGDENFTYGADFTGGGLATNASQKYWVGGMPNAINSVVTKLDVVNSPNNFTIVTTYVLSNTKVASSTDVQTGAGQPSRTTNTTYFYQ